MFSFITPDMMPMVYAAAVALVVVVIGLGLSPSEGGPSSRLIEKRLRRNDGTMEETGTTKKKRGGVRRDYQFSTNATIDLWLKRVLPNPDKLRVRLERTGKAFTIGQLLLVMLAAAMAVAIGLRVFVALDVPVCITAGLLVGLVIPNKIITIMGNRRVTAFMKGFSDAIDLIVRGLRSGLPFIESVNAVGKEFPDPIGIEFRRISDAVKLGQSIESAMWDVAERIDSQEYKFLIVAMSIQRETGGNLAETLTNLSDLLRKRRSLKLKIRAMSSEARASAYIIGSLPFIMFLLINTVNHEYISALWLDERGQHLALGGMCWMSIGFYVMYQMVNFEV